jgi:hypothetical protein
MQRRPDAVIREFIELQDDRAQMYGPRCLHWDAWKCGSHPIRDIFGEPLSLFVFPEQMRAGHGLF